MTDHLSEGPPDDVISPGGGVVHPPGDRAGPTRGRVGRTLVAPPALGASAVGFVVWLASLRPNLLPRPAVLQGAVSAVSFCVGYALGGLAIGLACRAGRRAGWVAPSPEVRRLARLGFAVIGGLGIVAGVSGWLLSQNDQRRLFTMPEIGGSALVVMAVVSVLVTLVLVLVGRAVGAFVGWGDRALARRLPPAAAHVIISVLVLVVIVGLFNRVVVDAVLGGADVAFSAGDVDTEPGVVQPTSGAVSGGPGSLVAWDTLGLQGRTWVAGVSSH